MAEVQCRQGELFRGVDASSDQEEESRARRKAKKLAYRQRLRRQMIVAYGSRCACCGEDESAFLTLDHVNGGGKEHRRRAGNTDKMLREIRARGWPKDEFRLLCWNCNCGRRGGECPHVNPWAPGPKALQRTHKLCPSCGETKEIASQFFRSRAKGPSPYCKSCAVRWRRRRRHDLKTGSSLPDLPAGIGAIRWCNSCKLHRVATNFAANRRESSGLQSLCKPCAKARRRNDRKLINATERDRRDATRRKVMDGYGGRCGCCGESEWRFLTIDHIHNDGKLDRSRGLAGFKLWLHLIKMDFPRDRYRCLCFNCNCARRHGSCPHESRRDHTPSV